MKPCLLLHLLACAALLPPAWAQPGWTPRSVPTTEALYDIVDFNTGPPLVVVGGGGTILRSLDAGESWTTPASGTTEDLLSITVVTNGQYYIGGTNGTVLYADNAAESWVNRSPATSAALRVFTRTSGSLFAVGDGGVIFKSEDAAESWAALASGTTANLNGGTGFPGGLSVNRAYIAGDGGTILKSENGGATWTPKPSGTTQDLYRYREPNYHLVVGAGGTVLRSTDQGETWTTIPTGTTADLYSVGTSGVSVNLLTAVGAGGTILRSTDGGLSWCAQESGTTADLYGVRIVNGQHAYAVGAGGTFLKTTDGGGACVVLPVELGAFSVRSDGRDAVLAWATLSETNNAGFEVEHERGGAFAAVAFVAGAGTTSEARQYRHRVADLLPGRHRFRLRQVDYDGTFEYSAVVETVVAVPGTHFLSPAYPNPFNPQARITLVLSRAQHVRIEVFNVLGQQVAALQDGWLEAGTVHAFDLGDASWPSGTYLYRVTGETFAEGRTVMLAK